MNPFKLSPAYKDYLWGGNNLKAEYGKDTTCTPLAESWELSAHPDGENIIQSGELKGMSFAEFVKKYPKEWSKEADETTEFPILVKLIDAKKSLSIQVHPNDEYAYRVEGEQGKNEMWIILQAEPNAFLYYGFEKPVDKEEFAQRIENNTLTEILHKQPVKPGEVYYIPAGTIHAIGEGIVLAEVQQSSNSTYRVYDFGRLGADGKPRPLHVQKALDVTQLKPAVEGAPGAKPADSNSPEVLADSEYFVVKRVYLKDEYKVKPQGEFIALLCVDGQASLSADGMELSLKKGETIFIPATSPEVTLQGTAEVLQIAYKA